MKTSTKLGVAAAAGLLGVALATCSASHWLPAQRSPPPDR